jgi:polar amino acid transport system substrate-binding protein
MGAFPAIVDEIARRTGLEADVAVVPFPRIDRELESGTKDCTIILWNDRRDRIVEKGEWVYMMSFGVIAREGIPLKVYDDLRPLTISVTRNLAIDPRFDADDTIRKDLDKDYELGLQKIAHKRLDAIAGAIPTIRYLAKKAGLGRYLGEQLQLTQIPLTLQCSKASPMLRHMPQVNEAIRQMRSDGTMADILSRYDYF